MLISWSSWGKIFKKLIRPHFATFLRFVASRGRELFLPVLLFLEVGLFWQLRTFGTGFLNGLIALAIFIGSLYFYIKDRKASIEPLVTLSLFLGFTILFYLHFNFPFPLWLSEILVFLFSLLLFVYLCFEEGRLENSFMFSLALLICVLEVFFILSFWPTNPLSKSFILTSVFYLFWHVIIKREKPLSYLILTAVVLILVITTTRWPVV